jgi:hypothetical protein
MRISEIDKALGEKYREFKASNGGHKTAPKGKFGVKSIQFAVRTTDGKEYGPFLGRGSALKAYRTEVATEKAAPGTQFIIKEIFISKKDKTVKVDKENIFEVTE